MRQLIVLSISYIGDKYIYLPRMREDIVCPHYLGKQMKKSNDGPFYRNQEYQLIFWDSG